MARHVVLITGLAYPDYNDEFFLVNAIEARLQQAYQGTPMQGRAREVALAQLHGVAEGTLDNYQRRLRLWGDFCHHMRQPFNRAPPDKIKAFAAWLHYDRNIAADSTTVYIASVKSCFDLL